VCAQFGSRARQSVRRRCILTYQLTTPSNSPINSPHRLTTPPPTQNFRWTEEEVNAKLEKAMKAAFADVWEVHTEAKLPLRTAAFVKALQRVTRARVHRGFD